MKEFLAILFLSKVILLTPAAVDLNSKWFEITPRHSLKAVTSGAHISVDLTAEARGTRDFAALEALFPKGTIEAKMVTESGQEVTLCDGGHWRSKDTVGVTLGGCPSLSTDVRFTKVLVRSARPLHGVTITWCNFML